MAIPHANSGQPIDIQPLGPGLPNARTVALFKTAELEVMRLVLPAGRSLPPHRVPGEITIQCIEGKIEVTANELPQVIHAGQLLYLSGGVLHSLLGLEDASALVTIVLRK
jgi:quercetin dioxygenase-like cupin family protein